METRSKIGLVAAAILIDGIQALLTLVWVGLFINPIISVGAAYIFNHWFKIYGINMLSKNNIGLFYGTIAAELIPFFDALPVWTTGVVITLARNHSKKESSKNQ